jgi:hypothetical protein
MRIKKSRNPDRVAPFRNDARPNVAFGNVWAEGRDRFAVFGFTTSLKIEALSES